LFFKNIGGKMAGTFHKIYIQIVFSVKHREKLIPKEKRENLNKYITGIVNKHNCKMIAVNTMSDHVHIFIDLNPAVSISDLVKDIKLATTDLIKREKWFRVGFHWQGGYGVFSYSEKDVPRVIKYIEEQEIHHKTKLFREEYEKFLNDYGIKYDKKYLLDS
jgi:putative transposase